MLTLIPDVQITRRKRVHLIVNEDGDLRFPAKTIEEAMHWLEENEHQWVILDTRQGATYRLEVKRIVNALRPIRLTSESLEFGGHEDYPGDDQVP